LGIKPGDYRTFSYEKGVNANHHLAVNFIVRREISTAFRLLFVCYILNMHAVTQDTIDEFNGSLWLSIESLDCHKTRCNCLPYRGVARVGRLSRLPLSAEFKGQQMDGIINT
jgi:hypothetical protein